MKESKLQSEANVKSKSPNILSDEQLKDSIVLLQDIGTMSVSCSRCHASGDNSNEIQHKACCPYIWGPGC